MSADIGGISSGNTDAMSEAPPQRQGDASRGAASQSQGRGRRRRNNRNRPAQQPTQPQESQSSQNGEGLNAVNAEQRATRGGGNRAANRGRGRGGRQRGSALSRPTVQGAASSRSFGGHLTSSTPVGEGSVAGDSEAGVNGLNAQANDFVPGQPVVESRYAASVSTSFKWPSLISV